MLKTTTLAALTLAALGGEPRTAPEPPPALVEERVLIKYVPALDEASVLVDAESDVALDRVEVRDPSGRVVFRIGAPGGPDFALSDFVIESQETTLEQIRKSYPAGVYHIRARRIDGRASTGAAALGHEVLDEPEVIYPTQGAGDVPVKNMTVHWNNDPKAELYKLMIEQEDNDGLDITLPSNTSSFTVPDGVLAPRTETQVEIIAIHANGNQTSVEIEFTTE